MRWLPLPATPLRDTCPDYAPSGASWFTAPAQGVYSHSLAEYSLTACNWFAKDLPRLRRQQVRRNHKQEAARPRVSCVPCGRLFAGCRSNGLLGAAHQASCQV
jgi:hypothetical protein